MNKNQENKRSMFNATARVLNDDANKLIYTSNGPLNANFSNFTDKLEVLAAYSATQSQSVTGFTELKASMRFGLVIKSLQYSGAVKSYAATNNLPQLYNAVDFSPSNLFFCRDTVIIDRCTVISKAMTDNAAALVTYGITAAITTDFKKDIQSYTDFYQTPRAMKAANKVSSDNIKKVIKEIDALLKRNIDNDMLSYIAASTDFYNQYTTARKVIDLSGVRTTLKGHLIDETTTRKLRGLVIIKETGETLYGNSSGIFKKSVSEGIYTLVAKVPGWEDKTISNVIFEKGKVLNLDIKLNKAA